jgi:Xaa-Pro aminopeptidase
MEAVVAAPAPDYAARIRAIRENLGECDSALITNINNIRYLTGFTGSAGLFALTPAGDHLVVDARYTAQAAKQCTCDQTLREGPLEARVATYLRGGRRCAIESRHVTLEMMRHLELASTPGDAAQNGSDRIHWTPVTNLVERIRIRKDEGEIQRLRAAADLLETLMAETMQSVRAGRTEIDVALEFEMKARRATGCPLPFEPIIASGPRSALPHGVASAKEINHAEFVMIDIGLELDGYVADMTRTVAVGAADDRMREVHAAVHLANRTAAKGIRVGMTGEEAHNIAAGVLEAAGLAQYFGHGLGHGIGIEIHEDPRLASTAGERLDIGMCFTIEPGVYIPDWGGVRIEDAGVLLDDGLDIFNKMDRALVVV